MGAFENERIRIGEGMNATVYKWNGYAYKCFKSGYPREWLDYEVSVQSIIESTGQPVAKYYPSEFENSVKMDLLEGETLADRMRLKKYANWLPDMLDLFDSVHSVECPRLHALKPKLAASLERADITDLQRASAIGDLSKIRDGQSLCHLDFHFLNILFSGGRYYIIDWVNAKSGNPVFDFARTYVIMHEFAFRLSGKFLKEARRRFEQNELSAAIRVMAADRIAESDSPSTRKLLDFERG